MADIRSVDVLELAGNVASDKDVAKHIRTTIILPALTKRRGLRLDFTGVRVATHSFIHACISEAFRQYGDSAIERIEFHHCSSSVRTMIQTVIDYSLDHAVAGVVTDGDTIPSTEVPQADDLAKVRRVLEEIAKGIRLASEIAASAGYTPRHVTYRIASASLLGLVSVSTPRRVTNAGMSLLRTAVGHPEERQILRKRLIASTVFQRVVPDLFAEVPPERDALAMRIMRATGMKRSTARRRAGTLLSWRRQLLAGEQELPLL